MPITITSNSVGKSSAIVLKGVISFNNNKTSTQEQSVTNLAQAYLLIIDINTLYAAVHQEAYSGYR